MVKGVLLDLAGVLFDGDTALPGSVKAVADLRRAGLPVRFLTNSTRSNRRSILDRLHRLGFDVTGTELFTPARAACDVLKQRQARAHLLIHPDLAEDFTDVQRTGGKTCVVVGDAAQYFTFDAMNAAFRELIGGADLLALAANRSFRDSDGELSIDAGAFVRALEYATGKQAQLLGKPARGYFDAALDSMGCAGPDAVMVGDDAEADVSGALTAGVGRAILVQSGKYRPGDETRFDPAPSYLARDLVSAVSWILDVA